jgi:hypothetical protein
LFLVHAITLLLDETYLFPLFCPRQTEPQHLVLSRKPNTLSPNMIGKTCRDTYTKIYIILDSYSKEKMKEGKHPGLHC